MLETLEENIRTVLAPGNDNSLESINERMEKLKNTMKAWLEGYLRK